MFSKNKTDSITGKVIGSIGLAAVFVAVFMLKLYKKLISPFLPKACRYYPTCSEYSVTAFKRYGFIKGLLLSVRRVLRCNPLFPGGYDPVP